MKKGSHNTMTYLKPSKWYLYPFIFIAKCQLVKYNIVKVNRSVCVYIKRVIFYE